MQYFKVIGTTPIKFVIEMGLGVCIEEWYTLAQKLQDMGSVLLYERAGIGRSTESQYTRTPKVIAKELHDLMLYVKCEEKIILIAHSQGGLYAQQYIRLFPEEVEGIMLIEPLSVRDYIFKEQLTEKEYAQSGIDKSRNLLIFEKLSRLRLGWIVKKMMNNAPPLYYAKFPEKDMEIILDSYTNITHLRTSYQEYYNAHVMDNISELMDKNDFPDIPLTLITHSSEIAIEESIKFGNNSRDFAIKIENMWQDVMKDYLCFSKKARHVQAEHSGHYIHLTEPELIINEVKKMLLENS